MYKDASKQTNALDKAEINFSCSGDNSKDMILTGEDN